jgi:hypothetical protein
LCQDDLVAGLIENIISVNPMFDLLPFDAVDGNALAYNRENAIGGAGVGTVGTAISAAVNVISGGTDAKAAATFTQITSALTSILADAEVNGLIEASRNKVNDQKAVQVASKAKSVGRQFQHMLINGLGSGNQFSGLDVLCASGQKVDTGVDGSVLSFPILDELLDLVLDKDGDVDFITMPARTIRSLKALYRALGGANISEVKTLPSGREVPVYCGVPIFRNDYIPIDVTKGATDDTATIYAGTFDDGSRTHGIAGLTAADMAGIRVVAVGEKEDADENITRVKWYCGLANFSEKGLALADGIRN